MGYVRPTDSVPFPNVWMEFMAKESKTSDHLVKYRIQDLPEDRFEEALQYIADYFLPDAPVTQLLDGANKPDYVEDFLRPCRVQIKMKMSVVCVRDDEPDKIIGFNLNYVSLPNNTILADAIQAAKSDEYKQIMDFGYKAFMSNAYDKYRVDKYLTSTALLVLPQYRGIGIGQKLLEARKPLCKAFGIKITQTLFTSDYSNTQADRVGFKSDIELTTDQLSEIYPTIDWTKCTAKKIALKTWDFTEK